MKLALVGHGRWTVYAACRADGSCPLYDFLIEIGARRAQRVLRTLKEYVPATDPSEWVKSEFSKRLLGTESIFEFRWPARGGGTPRVFWFYDEGRVIVCSHGLDKKGRMPAQSIVLAEETRRAYTAARASGSIEVLVPGPWGLP